MCVCVRVCVLVCVSVRPCVCVCVSVFVHPCVKRDRSIEPLMARKVEAARAYYAQVLSEFDATHRPLELV